MVVTTSSADAVAAFERRHLERVRDALAAGASHARLLILAGGLADYAAEGEALVGAWWCVDGMRHRQPVLPNPWDDRETIAAHEAYVWDLSGRLIEALGARLDALHGTNHGRSYWDLLLRPWLNDLTAVVVDRRLTLLSALACAPDVRLAVAAGPAAKPPATLAEGMLGYIEEGPGLDLVARLAPSVGMQSEILPRTPAALPEASAGRAVSRFRMRELARRTAMLAALWGLGGWRGRRVLLLGDPQLRPGQALALAIRARGVRFRSRRQILRGAWLDPALAPDAVARAELAVDGGDDPRAAAVAALLPSVVPLSVVEGYGALVEASRRRLGPPCAAVLGGYGSDELGAEFVARAAAAGHRIAFSQHGGAYRQFRVNPVERNEIREGSLFVSWGWEGPGVRAVPSPHLSRLRDTYAGGTAVTIVEVAYYRSLLRFASVPLAAQTQELGALLEAFAEAVRTPGVAVELALKRYPGPYTGARRPPAVERLTHDRFASPRATDWMRRSRLAVVSYPDTTFIEALAIGVPTLGLWDPNRWELRDDARPWFDRLTELGVVFADPIRAARQVENVYADATSWWAAAEIQQARLAFLDRFGRNGDWLRGWTALVGDLAG